LLGLSLLRHERQDNAGEIGSVFVRIGRKESVIVGNCRALLLFGFVGTPKGEQNSAEVEAMSS
jgi:hypothetical protein